MRQVWLMGGFGNHLFQILAFRIIQKKDNNVKFNNFLSQKNLITFLLNLTIHNTLYDGLIGKEDLHSSNFFVNSLYVLLGKISKIMKINLRIAAFYSDTLQFDQKYSLNIFGYFQEKNFVNKNKSELFKLCKELRELYQNNTNRIVVHYRRGDSNWAIKHLEYYEKIKKMAQVENEKVVIVTDSQSSALKFFGECENIEFNNEDSDLEDFSMMVSAKKLYCAPSTFSWWAAHSVHENTHVIMPSFFKYQIGIYINNKNLTIIK